MEELTEAINSSSHSRVFAMHWNMDKDKRKVANQEKFLLQPHDNRKTESCTGTEKKQGLLVAGVHQMERGVWQ
jgi:hypothetical protein